MRDPVRCAVSAGLLILIFMTVPALAVSITESPDVLNRGGQITITISDLNDGSIFSLFIDGKFRVVPGSWSSFQTRNFNMPFSLTKGTVSATTHGTTSTTFSVRPHGESIYNIIDDADANGDYSVSKPYTVNMGLYDFLKLEGPIRSDTTLLTTQMNLLGKKQGVSNSKITFTVDGIDNGEVWLTALVDGNQVMPPKKVVIGSGIPTPVPTTPAPTTSATTVAATTTTATPLPTEWVTEPIPTETTPPATETTPRVFITDPPATASVTAIPAMTWSSADRKVSLATEGVEYAALLMVSDTKVPDTWVMVSKAYAIAPDSLTFSPPATISFVTPASDNDYAYFIGRHLTSDWVAVPTSAGSGTIDGQVDLAGTYALMAFKPESTIKPTVKGTAAAATPTPLVTVISKPKIASIAQAAPSSPAAGPTRTPLDVVVVAGALAVGLVLVMRAKR